MHDSLRRFLCAGCGQAVFICPLCDRGQRYCAGTCAGLARRRSRREANRRYQRTLRGRLGGAERSRRYRERRRVTDQGSLPPAVRDVLPVGSATETQTPAPTPTRASRSTDDPAKEIAGRIGTDAARCCFCRQRHSQFIRHAPFRRRSSSHIVRKERNFP